MYRQILLAGLYLMCSTTLAAQDKDFVFTHFTREDKLLSNRVNYSFQDSQGFIWICTANGLQRFDGKRMLAFQHRNSDSTSIPGGEVLGIMEDDRKQLLVFTSGGVSYYDPLHASFRKVDIDYRPADRRYPIVKFIKDSHGSIWVMLYKGGLFLLDSSHKAFRSYTTAWPTCNAEIHHLYDDPSTGYYYLGTDSGIIVYDSHARRYYTKRDNPKGLACLSEKVSSGGVTAMYKDPSGRIWAVVWPAFSAPFFYRYDIRMNSLAEIKNPDITVFGFYTDAGGTTWAYGEGLLWFDERSDLFAVIPKKRDNNLGIDFDEIFNVFEDKENNIWCSTNMGFYQFNPVRQSFNSSLIVSLKRKEIVDANVNSFIETRDGKLIVLGWGIDGLYFYDTAFNRLPDQYGFNPADFSDGNFLMCWSGLQDSRGLIWIGCQAGRVLCIDPVTHKITRFNPPEFTQRTVRSMVEDGEGNIWMGTQNNVLVKWIRATNSFVQIMPPPPGNYDLHVINYLLLDQYNGVWMATSGGGMLHIDLKGNVLEQFKLTDKTQGSFIRSNEIQQVIKADDHRLLIATAAGIELFDTQTKQFIHVTEQLGLMSDRILSICKDDRNAIWYTTPDGISKIDLDNRSITLFNGKDGVTQNGFYPASILKLRNGHIVFGTSRGFVYFNPETVSGRVAAPDVRITSFSVFDKMLPVDSLFSGDRLIRLSYDQNFITIRFSAMSFLLNDKLDFFYQLEGIDKDWVKAGPDQQAVYSYLPGGTYTFRVKCISRNGMTSSPVTSFTIRITPPFWRAWWFYALLLLLAGGIVYFIDRIRIRRIRDMEKVRLRIARDLHDDMGSTLSTINILSAMAKTKMPTDPQKTGEYISKISDNSQRMMEAMDDIVWSIKPANDSMVKITARMREFATGILEPKDMELAFVVDDKVKDVKMDMEARRDFFLIFKEAVNNVAKYSSCTRCTIHIACHQKRLILEVQDNGIGFDVNNADNGNGLSNLQKRAEALKARVQVQSAPGKGTRVILNMPVG